MCGLQSVATIGSTLTSVQHDVKTMQTALESQKKDDEMKKAMVNSIMYPLFNADTAILCIHTKGFCTCTDDANARESFFHKPPCPRNASRIFALLLV